MTLVEGLRATRDLLAPAGAWCQGAYERNGARCLFGAACQVEGMQSCIISDFLGNNVRNVVGWNDAPGRTQAEVLSLLDGLIADAEREQS